MRLLPPNISFHFKKKKEGKYRKFSFLFSIVFKFSVASNYNIYVDSWNKLVLRKRKKKKEEEGGGSLTSQHVGVYSL